MKEIILPVNDDLKKYIAFFEPDCELISGSIKGEMMVFNLKDKSGKDKILELPVPRGILKEIDEDDLVD